MYLIKLTLTIQINKLNDSSHVIVDLYIKLYDVKVALATMAKSKQTFLATGEFF